MNTENLKNGGELSENELSNIEGGWFWYSSSCSRFSRHASLWGLVMHTAS